jgi:hypothetical protein
MAGAEFATDRLEKRAATQGRRPRHAVRDDHETWATLRTMAASRAPLRGQTATSAENRKTVCFTAWRKRTFRRCENRYTQVAQDRLRPAQPGCLGNTPKTLQAIGGASGVVHLLHSCSLRIRAIVAKCTSAPPAPKFPSMESSSAVRVQRRVAA